MIASPNHSARGAARVRLVVVHTAEGARTVDSLGAYFAKTATQASSHAGIDDQRIETYVPYDRASWTLRSGNPISDNVELCAFAAWSRDEWLKHPRMLELCAQWIRERCTARGVPIRKLTPAQVGAGEAGVCGHIDWTVGKKDGSHTDPGPGFPWDVVIEKAAGRAAPAPQQPTPQPGRSAADVLAANGIVRAPEVVELAAAAGLELAAACAMLEKESSGGRNVWGRDGTSTGGYYTKGAEVTRAAYEAWKPHRKQLGSQGVGPTQLTYGPFQDQADAQGGCWDWRTNIRVGFGVLAADVKARGVRLAFRTYNGGPNPTGQNLVDAERYADDAMNRYNTWRSRLAGATTTTEVDDMANVPQEQWDELLKLTRWMWSQLAGENAKPFEFTGWPSFPDGSGQARTLVDYHRQADVQLEDVRRRLTALEAKLK